MSKMKGIILSGGLGTRLHPLTAYTSKQLLPVYDKPMIYYPLSTLMLSGIREIALISTPKDLPIYRDLLGDGNKLGLEISYFEQPKPKGIAEAFIICEEFIDDSNVSLILGDNIFYGNLRLDEVSKGFDSGALIFGYPVRDPSRFGVIKFSDNGQIEDLVEKPNDFVSNYAIPGFYIYDNKVVEYSKNLKPSDRGELEITDLNRKYLNEGTLNFSLWGRGVAWIDTGTSQSLQEASSFIMAVENRQSYKISCPEEIAFRQGFIGIKKFSKIIKEMPKCDYRLYLSSLLEEFSIANGSFSAKLHDLQI